MNHELQEPIETSQTLESKKQELDSLEILVEKNKRLKQELEDLEFKIRLNELPDKEKLLRKNVLDVTDVVFFKKYVTPDDSFNILEKTPEEYQRALYNFLKILDDNKNKEK